MNELIKELTDKDDKKAYAKTKEIAVASEVSKEYYAYFDDFASLLINSNSYIRTRAFILCCSQARWDDEGKIRQFIPDLLKLFHDPKPTTVRQCLNAIKEVVVFRPELSEYINNELDSIDLSIYKDSMAGLISDDIRKLKELINELK